MHKYNFLESLSKSQISELNNQFWNILSENAYPVSHGKLRIPISLEPFIIHKVEYQSIQKDISQILSAAIKLSMKWFEDKELQKIVEINEKERDLIFQCKDQEIVGIVRMDLFYDEIPQMVEINADFPDGYFMHEETQKALVKNIKKLQKQEFSHYHSFNNLLKSLGVDFNNNIFIGFDKGRKFIDEFVLSQNILQKFGYENVYVDTFESLEFRNAFVYYKGKKIDVIRRGAELFKLRKVKGFIDNLIQVEKSSNVKVVNNFKMRLLGNKSMMAAMWDKRFHKYLDNTEIKAIKKILPETYKLSNFDNSKINKNEWVLKPTDLAEGDGITIGSSVSESEWMNAIKKAEKNWEFWIMQRKISIPEVKFNLINSETNEVESGMKKYDFNPHLIISKDKIEMGAILVRFSESSILNVMKGGGLTYCFVE